MGSSEVGGTISVIDAMDWSLKKKIGFQVPGVRPELLQRLAWSSPTTARPFVALGPANRVGVIDPKTYEVTDYILVGQRPWHLELSPDHEALRVTAHQRHDGDRHRRQSREVREGGTAALGRSHRAIDDRAEITRKKGARACERRAPSFWRS
ncbi:MAG: hypothetical protein R3D30_15145 [Hyphomicrobiales bacterium]